MTTEELEALPDDGKDRWLIDGQLRVAGEAREGGSGKRCRGHARIAARIGYFLQEWLEAWAPPRGEVLLGEPGFRLARDPDTTISIDVAYISAAVVAANPDDRRIIDGAPILGVEILSPPDTYGEVAEKVRACLRFGVKQVWVVDPWFQTVVSYRPDGLAQLFAGQARIDCGSLMPGFSLTVTEIFDR